MKKYILISTRVDWRALSWERPRKDGEVAYFAALPYEGNFILKKMIKFFYSWKINVRRIRVPFRSICYKGIIRAFHINDDDEVKIIFYDRSRACYDFEFLEYLRKQIPGVKIGYLFSDIVAKSGANEFGIVNQLNDYYDKVFSFDLKDAQKYGFDYSYLIYDRDITGIDQTKESDVFLVAKAKDRLEGLLSVFDLCVENGLKTDFAINDIPTDQTNMVGERKIQTNEVIPYSEVVERLNHSKCIVDIMQKGSAGITLNIVEAVVFNIKAISNNAELVNEPFYDPSRILILSDNNKDLKSFIDTPMKPYTAENRNLFSGTMLFERL